MTSVWKLFQPQPRKFNENSSSPSIISFIIFYMHDHQVSRCNHRKFQQDACRIFQWLGHVRSLIDKVTEKFSDIFTYSNSSQVKTHWPSTPVYFILFSGCRFGDETTQQRAPWVVPRGFNGSASHSVRLVIDTYQILMGTDTTLLASFRTRQSRLREEVGQLRNKTDK